MTANPPLTGPALDEFLGDIEDTLARAEWLDSDTGPAEAEALQRASATARQQLAAAPAHPADVLQLVRLHRAWQAAGLHEGARALLAQHGDTLLQAASAADRPRHAVALALARLHPGDDAPPHAHAQARAELAAALAAAPQDDDTAHAWSQLRLAAEDHGDHARVREALHALHALTQADPDRTELRAYDTMRLHVELAESWQAQGDIDQARREALAALTALGSAGADQQVDLDDWFTVGEQVLAIDPTLLEAVVAQVRAAAPPAQALPLARALEVRIARLRAPVMHARGDLAAAIAAAREGAFLLTSDDGDPDVFIQLADWLHAAGRSAESLRVMYDAFSRSTTSAAQQAAIVRRVQQRLAAGEQHTLLALVLADAGDVEHDDDDDHGDDGDGDESVGGARNPFPLGSALRGSESADAWRTRHIALARQWAGDDRHLHGMVDGEEAMALFFSLPEERLAQHPQDCARVVALLEQAARQAPDDFSIYLTRALWLCRIALHGARDGLAQPFVVSPAGLWAYAGGCNMEDDIRAAARRRSGLPADSDDDDEDNDDEGDAQEAEAQAIHRAIEQLKERYYSDGLARFERFFATGTGHYRDADVHVYSMLCNNLALVLRMEYDDRYDEAIALHRKGIAASPFAEHFDGIADCYRFAGNHAAFVDAADQVWRFASEHGYSRYQLPREIRRVAQAYSELERHGEVARWLPRLHAWWAALDEDEKAQEHTRADYLDTLAKCLGEWAYEQGDDAMAQLDPVLPALRAHGSAYALRYAGMGKEYAGALDEALALYDAALARTDPDDPDDETERDMIQNWRADLLKKMDEIQAITAGQAPGARKPWWKVW